MDWSKAKNILIVALIITNLILIFSYCFKQYPFENTDEGVISDTIALLESKNIYVEAEIPAKHYRMAVLSVEYDKMDQQRIADCIKNQRALDGKKHTDVEYRALADKFIEDCGLNTENVKFSRIKKSDDVVKVFYKNYINDIAIEDSYIICSIRGGKVNEIERFWLNPIEFGKMKKDVITASAALVKFMSENEDNQKITIEDISLVYWLDSGSFDTESPVSDTAFPAWKITYNEGEVKYIMGFEQ